MTTDTNGEFEQKIPNVFSAYQVVLKNQGNVIVTHMRGSRNVTQRAKIGKKTWSPYVKKLVLLVVPKPVFTRSNNIKMFVFFKLDASTRDHDEYIALRTWSFVFSHFYMLKSEGFVFSKLLSYIRHCK